MKLHRFFIIAIAILLSSCSKHNKQTQLIDQVNITVGILEDENSRLMGQFDRALNRIGFGNPEMIMVQYNAALRLRETSDEVIRQVNLFAGSYSSTSTKGIKSAKNDQPSEEFGLMEIHRNLQDKVNEFNDLVNYTACNLLKRDQSIPEPIAIPAEIMQIFNANANNDSEQKNGIIFTLSALKLSVLSTEYLLLGELLTRIDGVTFFRHRLDVIVEPESEIIGAGNTYTAKIYTGFINQPDDFFTPTDYQLILSGNKYTTKNGSFLYAEKVPSERGSYIRNGMFLIPHMARGDTLAVPFSLAYSVD